MKNIFFVCVLSLLYGCYFGIPSVFAAASKGDANLSGSLTYLDADLISQYAVGLRTLTDEQKQAADMSGDGQVTSYDAALLLQEIKGNGDVNGDGIIDQEDAQYIQDVVVGISSFTANQKTVGDVSGDGSITSHDAALLLQWTSTIAVEAGSTSAVIIWTTPRNAESRVEYGATNALGLNARDTASVTSHRVLLDGLSTGTTYLFRVRSQDSPGNTLISEIKTFTTSANSPVINTITITSPKAGDQWQKGRSYLIQWSAPTSTAAVNIFLDTGIRCIQAPCPSSVTIASNASNSGSYSWIVPANLDASSNYQIFMYDVKDSRVSGTSGRFSIVDSTSDEKPDLVITNVMFEPDGPYVSRPFTGSLAVTVKNWGGATNHPEGVRVSHRLNRPDGSLINLGGELKSSLQYLPNFFKGEEKVVRFPIQNIMVDPSPVTVTAYVDNAESAGGGFIPESNETNNMYQIPVYLKYADTTTSTPQPAPQRGSPISTESHESDELVTLRERVKKLEYRISELEQQIVEREKELTRRVDERLTDRVKGNILLQVHEKGEAWYVDPVTKQRFYLKDGNTAYTALRAFGLGITNSNLETIPIGIEGRAKDVDSDGDGLPDKLEQAIGTSVTDSDSDDDGFSDGDEIKSGHNPTGPGRHSFGQLKDVLDGRVLLQVESRGEAWYVHDGKRYYLSGGDQAYQIMRYLSLGITNENLRKIAVGEFE